VRANPGNRVFEAQQLAEANAVAAKLGVALTVAQATRPEALEAAFEAMTRARAEALLILGDPMFALNTERIARLSVAHRLPAVGPFPSYADGGALLAYGADFDEMFRRAAVYVDRILKGAKPADLPVERATRFELTVNLRTARALGITLPPALVARADRRVE
jgi:putative ABC transport system substrate-binding protein